jgi:hypothetical protein
MISIAKLIEEGDFEGAIDAIIQLAEQSINPDLLTAEAYHIAYVSRLPPEERVSEGRRVVERLQYIQDSRFKTKNIITKRKLDPVTERKMRLRFSEGPNIKAKKRVSIMNKGEIPGRLVKADDVTNVPTAVKLELEEA